MRYPIMESQRFSPYLDGSLCVSLDTECRCPRKKGWRKEWPITGGVSSFSTSTLPSFLPFFLPSFLPSFLESSRVTPLINDVGHHRECPLCNRGGGGGGGGLKLFPRKIERLSIRRLLPPRFRYGVKWEFW